MLSFPVEKLPYIGSVFQKKLKKLRIKTVEDLLFHFPHRYEDFSNIIPISKIKLNQTCSIQGKILKIENSRTWKKRMILTQAIVEDKTGAIKIVWFNQSYLIKILKPNDFVCLAGKVVLGNDGIFLSNPIYEKILNLKSETLNLTHTARLVPVYPETEKISSRWLRWIIRQTLDRFKDQIKDYLPLEIIKKYKFLPLEQAISQIHFPDTIKRAKIAKARFCFEELFFLELAVLKERLKLNQKKAPAIPIDIDLIKRFVKSLPFSLTNAQKKCAWQILKDLEKPIPGSRLLQGDVGSGKTLVIVIPALNTVKAGYQVAFMAPTEILAKQHFKEISKLLRPFKIRIALLTSKQDKIVSLKLPGETTEISRNKLLEKIKKGEVDILIGTHALIQDKVKFVKLGFCIVDEQHRFGIEQRARLIQNSKTVLQRTFRFSQSSKSQNSTIIPHFVSATATPIPRSLALTIYGNLDLSLLDEMPKGRKNIITEIVLPEDREKTYDFIRERVKKGEQAFVICPRIEASDNLQSSISSPKTDNLQTNPKSKKNLMGDRFQRLPNSKQKKDILGWAEVKAVEEEYEKLSKEIFPDLKVEMLHGKMKIREKDKIMKDFNRKKIDILVSTSVVEVGIDIPNATIMMIEGAERFGLAQLYQFRGRVGRSDLQSYCFLFSDSPSIKTKARLKALLKAKNGFELAQKDLEIRGPGSFTGIKQWGIPDLAMENLKNLDLIEKTREAAKKILEQDSELKRYPLLKEKAERFKEKIHFE